MGCVLAAAAAADDESRITNVVLDKQYGILFWKGTPVASWNCHTPPTKEFPMTIIPHVSQTMQTLLTTTETIAAALA